MCTHGRSSFPRIIILFKQGRRVFHSPSQILVPRSKSSFLVLDTRSLFWILVPRSGSSFLVPDVTYRFITPSPPSKKEASLNMGIIYTIIFNISPGNTGLKTCNSLKSTFKAGGSTEKIHKITTMRRGPSVVCLVRASLLSCVLLLFMVNPYKILKGEAGR